MALSTMHIQAALPEDIETLTSIAFAAKRHWSYPETWIQAWADELTFTENDLHTQHVFKAISNDRAVGVYALKIEETEAELVALWILPEFMKRGIGRALVKHAESTAISNGATRLTLLSDPHAEGFYLNIGASVYGQQPASMDDQPRFLPLIEKRLKGDQSSTG